MKVIKYVCLGSDQAIISEDKFNNGHSRCGGECTLKGHPLVKGDKCKICGKNFAATAPHKHNN